MDSPASFIRQLSTPLNSTWKSTRESPNSQLSKGGKAKTADEPNQSTALPTRDGFSRPGFNAHGLGVNPRTSSACCILSEQHSIRQQSTKQCCGVVCYPIVVEIYQMILSVLHTRSANQRLPQNLAAGHLRRQVEYHRVPRGNKGKDCRKDASPLVSTS